MVKKFQIVTKAPQDALAKLLSTDLKPVFVVKVVQFMRAIEDHVKTAQAINQKLSEKLMAKDEDASKEWLEYLNEEVEISPLLPPEIIQEVEKLTALDYVSLEQLVEGGKLLLAEDEHKLKSV